ncbi:hypothetical protein NOVOSPHI9U_370072 [Novosphingobium sp. 9U]|nr:hypothetical protein NOVOSPHI9U_370072 [Novosphingobium sp. 9U]
MSGPPNFAAALPPAAPGQQQNRLPHSPQAALTGDRSTSLTSPRPALLMRFIFHLNEMREFNFGGFYDHLDQLFRRTQHPL